MAELTPGDLNRVFFTTGGSEAVESAWKLARQYFRMTGQPQRTKVISRNIAYHGAPWAPCPSPASRHQDPVRAAGARRHQGAQHQLLPGPRTSPTTTVAFGRWAADAIEQAILSEGPDTVAAVFLEPVQNAGGCFPPPPGYFQRVREICDRYGVLLVSDEVICAFGRLGLLVRRRALRLPARHHHHGQGPDRRLRAARGHDRLSDRLIEPFLERGERSCTGSPSPATRSAARWPWPTSTSSRSEQILRARAGDRGRRSAPRWTASADLPIVGDVRGAGFFYGIELVKDKDTRADLRRRRVRAPAPRLPLGGPVRGRADLPGRRPGGPRGAAGPAAHLRAGGDRLHDGHAARGPDRGVAAGLSPTAGERYRRLSLWWDAAARSRRRPRRR